MKLGKPIKYLAVDPKEVVERVKKLIKDSAERQVQKLRDLSNTDVLTELNTLHHQGIEFVEVSDLSGAIKGRHNVYSHMELLVKNAEKSVTIMTTSKGLLRKIEALGPVFEKLAKKNVKIRVVAPITKENAHVLKEIQKFAEVRHANKADGRFVIVDGKDLLFMVMDDKEVHPTYDIGVWVNTPFFANALENLFNIAWKDLPSADKALKST